MDWLWIGYGLAMDWRWIGERLAMDWPNHPPTCPNHPPSRHFGRLPCSALVPRLLTGVASDWQWIGVICANACRTCVDPVLMIGSDIYMTGKGIRLTCMVGQCGIGSRGFAMN